MVVLASSLIALHADACPVIENIAQAKITAVAHNNLPLLSTLTRHRRNPTISPQGVIVSAGKRLGCLREHGGGYDSSDSRQGTEQFDVTMPAPWVSIRRRC